MNLPLRNLALAAGFSAMLAVSQSTPAMRRITFNGRPLPSDQMTRLERVERYYGVRIPDNDYWYDSRSGAAGFWNGPAVAALPPGLDLGGPMPANASGGGTGVFVNGRELHPYDVAVLSNLGPVYRGRYWVEANGNFGLKTAPRSETYSNSRAAFQTPAPTGFMPRENSPA